MRSLAGTNLESNQSGVGVTGLPYDPIWKLLLSRSSQTTRTYTKTRIISITRHIEEEYNQTAIVLLDNSDGALTSIDFEMYRGDISYGYNDPTKGDEYSTCAPLYVKGQRFFSSQGVLVCQLTLIGIPNLMAMDKAESELTLTDGDARTVKDLITAIANATLAPYTNYTNYTVTYDSEDSIIDSLKPKESFQVGINDNRLEKIRQLLGWTGCKMRVENDSAIHIYDPKSAAPYDYEYKLAVSGEHTFFNKELRNRFVNPNKTVVKSREADVVQYSGSATSATSYALFPKTETLRLKLVSDTEAGNIATARIESHELDADKGAVLVPMNVGQEVFDYIKVTDSRQDDSRVGNVRRIERNVRIPQRDGRLIFDMDVRFGKTLGLAPITVGTEIDLLLSVQALEEAFWIMWNAIFGEEIGEEGSLLGRIIGIEEHIAAHHDYFYSHKLEGKDIMKIPLE